mgnify:FL=1
MGCDYDINHVDSLLNHGRDIGIWTSAAFWQASGDTLRRCYNGIGPDAWSSRFRGLVTMLLEPFEIAALPHDFDFGTAARTYFAFTVANIRFAVNAILEAFHRHPLCLPLNKISRQELQRLTTMILFGLLLAVLCQCFGWGGFKNTKMEDYK